jgi:three-Cys-motif partner protein
MSRKRISKERQDDLFSNELEEHKHYVPPRTYKPVTQKIWTKNKSLLVSAYLKQFVYVTWRGTYIDGFSGPQYPDEPDYWCARQVLETQKRFAEKKYGLGNYFLVEKNPLKVLALEELQSTHLKAFKKIELMKGDVNVLIDDILAAPELQLKEPAFCLLDQHSTECHWNTVLKLANHDRPSGFKVEQFYFLATSWLPRVFGGSSKIEQLNKLDLWWGDRSWKDLKSISSLEMALIVVKRFKGLGYRHVTPWPIFKKGNDSSRVMYYMIHASDHDKAPQLMENAYHKIIDIRDKDAGEQIEMIIGTTP